MTWIIFFNWFSLYDNKRVKFVEMMFIGIVQFYWESIEDCLERRGKPPIIDQTKIKQKLQEKYIL